MDSRPFYTGFYPVRCFWAWYIFYFYLHEHEHILITKFMHDTEIYVMIRVRVLPMHDFEWILMLMFYMHTRCMFVLTALYDILYWHIWAPVFVMCMYTGGYSDVVLLIWWQGRCASMCGLVWVDLFVWVLESCAGQFGGMCFACYCLCQRQGVRTGLCMSPLRMFSAVSVEGYFRIYIYI